MAVRQNIIATWLFLAAALLPAAEVRKEIYNGKSVYTLENDKLLLRIQPDAGGRGISFYIKDLKRDLVDPVKDCGLFLDHWSKHTWPSGLMHQPYSAEEVRIPGGAGIRLKLTVPDNGGGKGTPSAAGTMKIPTEKEFRGLEISKTILLKDGSDVITVRQELRNPTRESRSAGLYIQHGFGLTPDRNEFRWDMPSSEGIYGPARKPNLKCSGPFWITAPTAGWISVSDLHDFSMVFEFDYNYLDRLYSCGTTAEWFMENVMLSPGKVFKTTYRFYPLRGFERITCAKNGIAAGIRADETADGFRISADLISKTGTVKDLKLSLKIYSHRRKILLAGKTFSIRELAEKKQTFSLVCPVKEEIVIKADLSDTGKMKDHFEYNYVSEQAESDRRFHYGTIGSGAAALPGGRGSAYRVKPPLKIKKMDLPDFSRMTKFPKDRNRMLVLFGLYTDHLQIFETFRQDSDAEIYWSNARPNGVGMFPAQFEELFKYRTIFMCNVNFKCLRFEGLEMIRNWVEQGGTLVITGGFYTYGNGEFEGSPFEQFVPFRNMKPFDHIWAGKGKAFLLNPAEKAPELSGVDFSSGPQAAWLHQVELKPGARVLVKAGDYPAIVKWRYGKGTVVACTLSPMGEPEKPFWLWDGWKIFLRNCSRINQN